MACQTAGHYYFTHVAPSQTLPSGEGSASEDAVRFAQVSYLISLSFMAWKVMWAWELS